MALHTDAVQKSIKHIGKPRADRRSQAERHLFIDNSCELLINDLTLCTWEVRFKASHKGP